jgi:signal transduction histidine kinase
LPSGEAPSDLRQANGCGISSEHLPHIFDPYWRASQTRRPGLGLGLAIAKGIVEAHDGRIWVESSPGAGSKFAFSLAAAD